MIENTMNWQELSSTSHYKTAMALKSQLIRLMLHIIKWQSQPERRSLSWVASIKDAREETPSLNDNVIKELWDKAFIIANRDAQAEMNKKSAVAALSWQEVFENGYDLHDDNTLF